MRSSSGPQSLQLSVRDYGIGVPVEHRPHLFERFYQAHAETHRSGLGLGLYISHAIVTQHGGEIAAEFPPEGGTRLVVTLPLLPPPLSPPTPPASSTDAAADGRSAPLG